VALNPPRTPLRILPVCNQPSPLQHFEMFRNCRLAHRERPGKFFYRRLARGKAQKNRAPGWVSEGGEREVHLVRRNHCITIQFYNQEVMLYSAARVKSHSAISVLLRRDVRRVLSKDSLS